MLKAEEAAAGHELAQRSEHRCACRIFISAGWAIGGRVGKGERIHIRKFQCGGGQDLPHRILRKRVGIIETSEFFFFDGRDNAAIVEKSRGGVRSWSGDAENVHLELSSLRQNP